MRILSWVIIGEKVKVSRNRKLADFNTRPSEMLPHGFQTASKRHVPLSL
ncbi:hypothetical protein NEIELOOT_00437 [Neisseria elongata subsp. glycolytica ATCC 29315]|uniref:Uncharacterized protein n=1 Tax=Neisseria elongata subsp. glycolytica ATCC 29315 TaxID=546263 RepID=D4DN12_NEIEG|nr:hypothetical protein NEIELOOT_00437 [Neisseria elongata subsp. glycolytica ATCC 29315]